MDDTDHFYQKFWLFRRLLRLLGKEPEPEEEEFDVDYLDSYRHRRAISPIESLSRHRRSNSSIAADKDDEPKDDNVAPDDDDIEDSEEAEEVAMILSGLREKSYSSADQQEGEEDVVKPRDPSSFPDFPPRRVIPDAYYPFCSEEEGTGYKKFSRYKESIFEDGIEYISPPPDRSKYPEMRIVVTSDWSPANLKSHIQVTNLIRIYQVRVYEGEAPPSSEETQPEFELALKKYGLLHHNLSVLRYPRPGGPYLLRHGEPMNYQVEQFWPAGVQWRLVAHEDNHVLFNKLVRRHEWNKSTPTFWMKLLEDVSTGQIVLSSARLAESARHKIMNTSSRQLARHYHASLIPLVFLMFYFFHYPLPIPHVIFGTYIIYVALGAYVRRTVKKAEISRQPRPSHIVNYRRQVQFSRVFAYAPP